MANAERELLVGADKLEDMCMKRSEQYQRIKANHEAWCVDRQQKQQMEGEELEDELRQLKKRLSDVEQEDLRASEELGRLLSRPRMHRDGSPDIEELFAEADKWHSDLRRIRADRDRLGENKEAIVREIEKIQSKLESLPAAYGLIHKEETRRLGEQLEDLMTARPANDVGQRQKGLLTGASPFAAEGLSPTCSMHEQRNRRSRSASLEIISPTEFRQSTFPSRSSHSLYEYENSSPAPSPASSRVGPVNASFLSNTHAEGTRANRGSTGSPRLELAGYRTSSTRRAQADAEAITVTAVQFAHHEVPNPYDIPNATRGKQSKTRRRSQVSGSESESDVPLAKRHKKAAKTVHFDQVNAENKNWRQGEKIYRISEDVLNSKKWYIFPCKKHCTGFKHGRGAAKHLARQRNGHPEGHRTSAQAVKELGVRVVGCDAGKRKRNNDAYDRAVGQGYCPSRRCNNRDCPVHALVGGPHRHSNSGQRQQSEDLEDSDSHSDEASSEIPEVQRGDARAHELGQQPGPPPTAFDPSPGQIYQAFWTSTGNKSWYPAAVLPWGDLREVGLVGSLDETALFKTKLPSCFAVEKSQDGSRIVGWKTGFQLHHRHFSERKFPCMFFEGISAVLPRDGESPQPQNLAWVRANHLRPINFRHLDGQVLKRAGLGEAKAFRERVIMLKSKATQEPRRFSQPLVDDDSDVAGARETPHPEHSPQHKGVKMEQEDVDFWL
ncbi:hypothetical protein FJTKL_01449 [Diaporthe vaccinii]|uniref:Uncharacterized protein n=1 Tax=Diaporthe vaccinii TaxID=105482 RepID=A0ABR4E0E8_9PEZI